MIGIILIMGLGLLAGCARKKEKPLKPAVMSAAQVTPQKSAAKKAAPARPITRRGATVVDRIVRRVNGVNILASDVQEPRFDRQHKPMTLEEVTIEELLVQKARDLSAMPSDLEVEKRVMALREAQGLATVSDEEFAAWVQREGGMTLKRLKRQVARAIATNQVRSLMISESGLVSEKEKRDYFAKTPFVTKERFKLESAFVEDDALDEKGNIKDMADLSWIDLGWVSKQKLSERMAFVATLEPGEISKPVKTEYGWQIIKLIEKESARPRTYEEAEVKIEKKLAKRKQKRAERELEAQLLGEASIVDFGSL